jgi:hypothetical protein
MVSDEWHKGFINGSKTPCFLSDHLGEMPP